MLFDGFLALYARIQHALRLQADPILVARTTSQRFLPLSTLSQVNINTMTGTAGLKAGETFPEGGMAVAGTLSMVIWTLIWLYLVKFKYIPWTNADTK